jgi:hypothetical protein
MYVEVKQLKHSASTPRLTSHACMRASMNRGGVSWPTDYCWRDQSEIERIRAGRLLARLPFQVAGGGHHRKLAAFQRTTGGDRPDYSDSAQVETAMATYQPTFPPSRAAAARGNDDAHADGRQPPVASTNRPT